MVQIHLPLPVGPLVKRLRHRPFTAETRVRFSYGSPFWEHGAGGSNPFTPTRMLASDVAWLLGQAVKTPPFHGGYRGSNPLGVTIFLSSQAWAFSSVGQSGRLITGWSGVQVPEGPPYCGPVVQLVRTPACHAGGRGFEPHPGRQHLPL